MYSQFMMHGQKNIKLEDPAVNCRILLKICLKEKYVYNGRGLNGFTD